MMELVKCKIAQTAADSINVATRIWRRQNLHLALVLSQIKLKLKLLNSDPANIRTT